jgi:hypothetical protein
MMCASVALLVCFYCQAYSGGPKPQVWSLQFTEASLLHIVFVDFQMYTLRLSVSVAL